MRKWKDVEIAALEGIRKKKGRQGSKDERKEGTKQKKEWKKETKTERMEEKISQWDEGRKDRHFLNSVRDVLIISQVDS